MNKLREIRLRCGLSGQGLAVKAGMSTSTITAIECWNYVPTSVTRGRIARVLNVPESEIWPDLSLQNEEKQSQGDDGPR